MVQDLSNLVLLARMQTYTRARSSVVACCWMCVLLDSNCAAKENGTGKKHENVYMLLQEIREGTFCSCPRVANWPRCTKQNGPILLFFFFGV